MKHHGIAASRRSLAVATGVPTRVEPHGGARRHYCAALQAAAALRRRLCGRWERYDGDALRECERRDFQPSFTACTLSRLTRSINSCFAQAIADRRRKTTCTSCSRSVLNDEHQYKLLVPAHGRRHRSRVRVGRASQPPHGTHLARL